MCSRRSLGVLLITCASVLALTTSCGEFPFETRTAPPPSGEGTSGLVQTQHVNVIKNVLLAFEIQRIDIYEDCFGENLIFRPAPEDSIELVNDYPGVFDSWDYTVEIDVTDYMLDEIRTSFILLYFDEDNEVIVDETESTTVYQEDYTLLLRWESIESYEGRLQFHMQKFPDGYWYITKWFDYSTTDQKRTWGYLKGRIRGTM